MAKKRSAFLQIADGIESLPWIVKLILALIYGFYGNLIRLFRSLGKKNLLGIILAVILLASGGLLVLWVIDFVMVVLNKKIWWID